MAASWRFLTCGANSTSLVRPVNEHPDHRFAFNGVGGRLHDPLVFHLTSRSLFFPALDHAEGAAAITGRQSTVTLQSRGDGSERALILLRILGQTAYVCCPSRYKQAIKDPELAVGFPLEDVRFEEAA